MSTTPKTPHQHAATIIAWANGAEIQTFFKIDEAWRDTDKPHWAVDREYRVKPSPVAIEPAFRGHFGELHIIGPKLLVGKAVAQLEQVNSTDEIAAHKAFDLRLELAEDQLERIGFERGEDGKWRMGGIGVNAKIAKEPDELARSSCRALCEYLGKTREDVTFDQIEAIVLLERLKP